MRQGAKDAWWSGLAALVLLLLFLRLLITVH
jgi:hypothetical protein